MGGIVRKDSRVYMLQEEREGWYLGAYQFQTRAFDPRHAEISIS